MRWGWGRGGGKKTGCASVVRAVKSDAVTGAGRKTIPPGILCLLQWHVLESTTVFYRRRTSVPRRVLNFFLYKTEDEVLSYGESRNTFN